MHNQLLNRIEINPKIMLGKPIIKGTWITVEIILKKLSQNISVEDILEDYPKLSKEDIKAAIACAAEVISTKDVLPDFHSSENVENPLKHSVAFEDDIISPIEE